MAKQKVLIFGTFDQLHPGHKFFIQQAAKHGDYLYIVVARDENVKKQKRYYPVQNENIRLQQIKQFSVGNARVRSQLGNRDLRKRQNIINKIKPDIICLGYDQRAKIKPGQYKIVRIPSYRPDKYKSSLLRKKKFRARLIP